MSQMYTLGLALPRPGILCLGVQVTSTSSFAKALPQSCLVKAVRRFRSTCTTPTGWPSGSPLLASKLRQSTLQLSATRNTRLGAPEPNARYISMYSDKKKGIFNKVIVHYVEIPPTYTDKDGLPFNKKGDLPANEVVKIFGHGFETSKANKLMRILHGRRVAGTLGDPTLAQNLAGYHQKHIDAALAYLRSTLVVDEVVNAGLQAEDELARLEMEVEDEAEQPDDPEADLPIEARSLEFWQRKLAREKPRDDVYGVGVQEAIRARNKAITEAAAMDRAEQKRLEDEEWAKLNPAGTRLATIPEQARNWTPAEQDKYVGSRAKLEEYAKRATSDLTEAPQMGHWDRFGSCILTAVAVVTLGLLFAALYKPPPPKYRIWPDVPPAAATLVGLIGANLIVYALWHFPPAWRAMNRLFILTAAVPNSFATVGCAFSHQMAAHMASNLFCIWLIGSRLHDDIGRGAFLATYFGTACVASVTASMIRIITLKQMGFNCLGASGVVFGLLGAYFTIHRWDDMHIWLLPEYAVVPGYAFLALSYLYVVFPALRAKIKLPRLGNGKVRKSRQDTLSHFTGLVAGTGYGIYFGRRMGFENAAHVKKQAPIELADPHKAFDISETPEVEQAQSNPQKPATSK